jgi:type II secretory pathway component PulK
LNVNTASDTVLKAYVPDAQVYERVIATRAKRGFINEMQLKSFGISTRQMAVGSNYFRLIAEAWIDGRTVRLSSVICRDVEAGGAMHLRVISRDLSREF